MRYEHRVNIDVASISSQIRGFISAEQGAVVQFQKIASAFLCLPQYLKSFVNLTSLSKQFKFSLTSFAKTISPFLLNQAERIYNNIIGRVAVSVTGVLNRLLEATRTINSLVEFNKSLPDKVTETLEYVKNQQNCMNAISDVLSCLLYSLNGELNKKLAVEISKGAKSLSDPVNTTLDNFDRNVDKYYNTQLYGVKKATAELNFINTLTGR